MIAAFVETDSSWKRATKFTALDPWRKTLIDTPLDTAEVITLLRAQRYSEWLAWKAGDTTGAVPVVYRADSSIHVWLVPETYIPGPTPSVGGERHYIFPPDAKKERSVAPVPALRRITEQVNGEWRIATIDTLPSLSELLLANMLMKDGHRAFIEMPNRVARLVGDQRNAVWVFLLTKRP